MDITSNFPGMHNVRGSQPQALSVFEMSNVFCSSVFTVAAAIIVVGVLLPAGCSRHTSESRPDPNNLAEQSGHDRMKALLKQIADNTPDEHPFLGTLKTRQLRSQLRQLEALERADRPVDSFQRWKLHFDLGRAETRSGNVEAGIDQLTAAYEMLDRVDFARFAATLDPDSQLAGTNLNGIFANRTRFYCGIANLRLGETQNCCLRHNGESCIMPIQGGGIHTQTHGSRAAARYFAEILANVPVDLPETERLDIVDSARWLLNVAHMTLGEYPAGVPLQHRMPTSFFETEIEFPRFRNVAPELNLDTFNLCGGAVVDDFNGDGYLDIVTSTWDTQGEMRYFQNNDDGSFSDRTEHAGLTGFYGGLNMVQADYDNDGDVDIFVLRGAWLRQYGQHPNSLLQNDGNGRFTDVTFESGLGEHHYPTKTAAWADYDNDGDLDLYVGNESTKDLPAPCQLFRNDGRGKFTDVAAHAGLDETLFAMGAVWGDFNDDRFPDLYVSTGFSSLSAALADGGPNRLYRNNRDGTFTDVAEQLQVTRPMAAFPAWFWDFDNDGVLDIYASCSSGPVGVLTSPMRFGLNCLYRGDGKGGFDEIAEQVGLDYPAQPMGANFGDLNNDGYPDFYLATGNIQYSEVRPNIMYLNQGGKRFANVTMAGGFGHLQKGHGVCFADLDNDGDQDVYVQTGGAWPGDKYNDLLYENPGFDNHWIALDLEGTESNRSAIGAKIHLRIRENGQPRSVYKWVNSGGSFGCNPLRQVIGIGQATAIERLEIFWPTTGKMQVFEAIAADQFLKIKENEKKLTNIELRRGTLRRSGTTN